MKYEEAYDIEYQDLQRECNREEHEERMNEEILEEFTMFLEDEIGEETATELLEENKDFIKESLEAGRGKYELYFDDMVAEFLRLSNNKKEKTE